MAIYRCRGCSYEQQEPWEDTCPHCNGFYRQLKIGADTADQKQRSTFAAAVESKIVYVPTGLSGLDTVLGGGLVAGSVILFGGFRGAGKSTLLVQCADAMAQHRKVVYASSEQSAEGVIQIAHRAEARSDKVMVLGNQKHIEHTIEQVKAERPFLTIYDSLQKYVSNLSAGVPGSAAQGTAVASAIKEDCRTRNACAIVVNQMARSGEMKGGSDVEHDLDTVGVLAYPKEDDEDAPMEKDIRVLGIDKNRNGPENLRTFWRMNDSGVMELVPPRSKIIDLGARRGKYSKPRILERED